MSFFVLILWPRFWKTAVPSHRCACPAVLLAAIVSMLSPDIGTATIRHVLGGGATIPTSPGPTPLQPNRDACWSELPNLNGEIVVSELFPEYALATRVANDFVFDEARTITKVRWWGGYYDNTAPCDPGATPTGFHLFFYTYEGCDPLDFPYGHWEPILEISVPGSAGETAVGCQSEWGWPLYRYEAQVDVPVPGGTRYWFVAQMEIHTYPPIWGRLSAGTVTGCESLFGSHTLEGWFWDPVSYFFGHSLDVSQEFECETIVPVKESSWGRIKSSFR